VASPVRKPGPAEIASSVLLALTFLRSKDTEQVEFV
jgi:hypothetical protein